MIPKVEASVRFAAGGRRAVIVDGREPHAVLHTLANPGLIGTVVLAENEHEG
jgi:acetylglutamate kinase